MRTLKETIILGLGLLIFAACTDEVAVDEPTVILSEADTFEILEESLSVENAGFVLELDIISEDVELVLSTSSSLPNTSANPLSDLCGESQSKSKSGNYEGPNVNWNYQWDWTRTLLCDENLVPIHFDIDLDASRSYENNQISTSGNVDGDWEVTFEEEASIKSYNGDYVREIDRQAKNSDRGHMVNLDLNIVDVKVQRGSDRHVLGGTLFFTLTGENNRGNTFSRSGKVVFNGDCTATINIDGGNSRTIQICD